jgi:DNA repair protein RecO (recombination protein O)
VPTLRDRVLLLRRFAFGETSLVVHALSQRHGRVHLLAKGAYRMASRYFGVLDLFDTLDLEWSHSGARELQLLRSGSILARRHGIARSLERYRAGLAVLELCEAASQLDQPAEELFELAERALQRIADAPAVAAPLAVFELGFLHHLGLAPALLRCATCGGAAPPVAGDASEPRAAFSASSGGRLCAACAERARASGRRVGTLPERILALAHALAHAADPSRVRASAQELERVRDVVARFLEYQLESRPKSYREFLSVPNRNQLR